MWKWRAKRLGFIIFFGLLYFVLGCKILDALADEEIEVVTLKLAPVAEYVETRPIEIREYQLDEDEVNTLAEFLWKSPLRDESEKVKLLWVVFNRIDDNSGKFGNTIEEVVRNKGEFTFMESHRFALSMDNTRIATHELNRWYSLKDGLCIGHHVKRTGVYCGFKGDRNREVIVYNNSWEVVE